MAVVIHLGDLDVVHLVILEPTLLLRLQVLGVQPPRLLAFSVLEFDDGDALAVVGWTVTVSAAAAVVSMDDEP